MLCLTYFPQCSLFSPYPPLSTFFPFCYYLTYSRVIFSSFSCFYSFLYFCYSVLLFPYCLMLYFLRYPRRLSSFLPLLFFHLLSCRCLFHSPFFDNFSCFYCSVLLSFIKKVRFSLLFFLFLQIFSTFPYNFVSLAFFFSFNFLFFCFHNLFLALSSSPVFSHLCVLRFFLSFILLPFFFFCI